jgi:acyl dehydratase
MVATTQVRFLVGANYGVDFKKIHSPVKPGYRGFLNWEKVSSS